jgi:hypothetical protein
MGRPADPDTPFRLKPHTTQGYTYASTQPSFIDPETGVKRSQHIHWGRIVDGDRFIPGERFFLATPEERSRLIFPDDWDISEAERFTGLRRPGRPPCDYKCHNRLYGDIWLLEQIALKTGLRQDLNSVFMGNAELVDDLLTLAMFPYLTGWTYNRVTRWQEYAGAPSSRVLTPTVITHLTQSITERHRMELFKLRAARVGKNDLCAVDTTTRSAYGDSLADIFPGKNKEHLPLEQTTEVVVYNLTNHMPIYYRTFPGNIPDSRTLDVINTDLDHSGFKDLVLITDRGFETIQNLDKYILRGQRMIMCAKSCQSEIYKVIEGLGEIGARPEGMEMDRDAKLYFKQFEINHEVKSTGASVKKTARLKLNLFFDYRRRGDELFALELDMADQAAALGELMVSGCVIEDLAGLRKENRFYKITMDKANGKLESFELNERKAAKAKRLCGFFCILTHKLDFDCMTTLKSYRLRDEQEKCFQQMKTQMVADRQRNWSEDGKTGRLFILFLSLILGSHVRHVWSSTTLRDRFSSSLDVLDAMRSIRCIEHANRAKKITPFVGEQLDICEAFGFKVPDGCEPIYDSWRKTKRKRGRPPKKRPN